ncbi:MAG: hypothetical protein ACXV5U_08140, partial [Ilumatobacteraceae bacterium]
MARVRGLWIVLPMALAPGLLAASCGDPQSASSVAELPATSIQRLPATSVVGKPVGGALPAV